MMCRIAVVTIAGKGRNSAYAVVVVETVVVGYLAWIVVKIVLD
jgi:hypothetical protein